MNRLLELAKRIELRGMPRWMHRLRVRPDRLMPRAQDTTTPADDSVWPTSSVSTLELQRIETQAERTIVQEIRLLERYVRDMLPTLQGEDLAYAHGLLLKLDRLAREQQADSAAPAQFLAPQGDWLQRLA